MTGVVRVAEVSRGALEALLAPYGLTIEWSGAEKIPGSYWGESEAGLIGNRLIVRDDTPLHSALHEACHYICADRGRRAVMHTDAGGDDLEECAVCYLQVLLAEKLPGCTRERMFADMDAWGYSFRLGSARAWFERDAEDARSWLAARGLANGAAREVVRLAIAAGAYALSRPGPGGWTGIAALPGGAERLLPAARPLDEAGLEAAIQSAEDWLMPHAASLRGQALEVADATRRLRPGLANWLGSTAAELSVEDVEALFSRAIEMTTGRAPRPEWLEQRLLLADLLLVRELAHHGQLGVVRLEPD